MPVIHILFEPFKIARQIVRVSVYCPLKVFIVNSGKVDCVRISSALASDFPVMERVVYQSITIHNIWPFLYWK